MAAPPYLADANTVLQLLIVLARCAPPALRTCRCRLLRLNYNDCIAHDIFHRFNIHKVNFFKQWEQPQIPLWKCYLLFIILLMTMIPDTVH